MDPDANLTKQRRLAADIIEAENDGAAQDVVDIIELAELVQALDRWIKRGGFLPKDWKR